MYILVIECLSGNLLAPDSIPKMEGKKSKEGGTFYTVTSEKPALCPQSELNFNSQPVLKVSVIPLTELGSASVAVGHFSSSSMAPIFLPAPWMCLQLEEHQGALQAAWVSELRTY